MSLDNREENCNMNNYSATDTYEGKTVELDRISKAQARKMFNEGKTVVVCTSKFAPVGPWSNAIYLRKDEDRPEFDNYVNHYEFYNCSYETGYYASFYSVN